MRPRRRASGRCATSSIWPARRSRSWRGGSRSCASRRRSASRPSSTRRRSARWSASSTSCAAPAIRPRPGSRSSKGRPTPVRRLQPQRPLPTTPRACRTGRRTWSGSRASSRARCSASRTRAASGSSPSTSAGSPRSRRCGPRTAATPKQVDQLIAQSAAVRDAQLSQLRAKEVEAAEKVRAANERVVASLEAEREALAQTERERFVAQALSRLSAEATAQQRREVEQLAGALFDEQQALQARQRLMDEGRSVIDRTRTATEQHAAEIAEAERAARSGRDRSGDLRPCGGGRERPRAALEPGVDRRRHDGS